MYAYVYNQPNGLVDLDGLEPSPTGPKEIYKDWKQVKKTRSMIDKIKDYQACLDGVKRTKRACDENKSANRELRDVDVSDDRMIELLNARVGIVEAGQKGVSITAANCLKILLEALLP